MSGEKSGRETSRPAISDKIDPALIQGVSVKLEAYLGSGTLTVGELMALQTGDSVPLDASLNRDVELRLNGVPVATGELVTIDGHFGVRILQIVR